MWIISLLPVLALVVRGGYSQHIASGQCPDVQAKHDFDLDSYLGLWHQWASYGIDALDGSGKCVKSEYFKNGATGKIDVIKTQVPLNRLAKATTKYTMVLANPTKTDAKLLVTLDVPVAGKMTAPLWILGTDYVSWSVAYSCLDFWFFHLKSIWILTRNPTPGDYMVDEVSPVLKKLELDASTISRTDQTDCDTGSDSDSASDSSTTTTGTNNGQDIPLSF